VTPLRLLLAWVAIGCPHRPTTPVPTPSPVATPDPAPDFAWVDQAIGDALEWEEMPGTTMPEGWAEERSPQLRAFFEAHPEYEDPRTREQLADLSCAMGIEDAHDRLTNPEPLATLEIAAAAEDWKVIVAYSRDWCTSDDWAWFTNDVSTAAEAVGVQFEYAGARYSHIQLKRGETEVATHALEGQGYLMLRAGKEPGVAGHGLVSDVLTDASDFFDLPMEEGE